MMRKLSYAMLAVWMVTSFSADAYAQRPAAPVQAAVTFPININEASTEQLQAINGIGQVVAERIIEYRENNGRFEALEDIMDVRGIGQAKFERIKNDITI